MRQEGRPGAPRGLPRLALQLWQGSDRSPFPGNPWVYAARAQFMLSEARAPRYQSWFCHIQPGDVGQLPSPLWASVSHLNAGKHRSTHLTREF